MPRLNSKTKVARYMGKAPAGQANLGDALENAVNKQRQEILDLFDAAIAANDKAKSKPTKPTKKSIPVRIQINGLTGAFAKVNRITTDLKTSYEALSGTELIHAANASNEARKAFDSGQIDSALKHFAKAERSIGAAIAQSQRRNLESGFAKAKVLSRHSKSGGSHEKQKLMREAWASGKYSSRDICAEQECAALGMSFSAARKTLRNTPDPT